MFGIARTVFLKPSLVANVRNFAAKKKAATKKAVVAPKVATVAIRVFTPPKDAFDLSAAKQVGKSDIATLLGERVNISRSAAYNFLEEFYKLVEEVTVKHGKKIVVPKFGRFEPKVLKSRTARNVKTGEPIQVKGYTKIGFRGSKQASSLPKADKKPRAPRTPKPKKN